ncbi:2Fe-2S iron-sulfur cluster binding domain-containing protein [Elizabethkingia sp. JS20170427COW]|nr:2Fe-2S iron-sulfur cluster binding domain-containing protein [Elizabethkingia sp. JS20170427COW]
MSLPQFHWLKLTKKIRLTKTSYQLCFEIPGELKNEFSFEAGQYCSLKYKGRTNDYSIVSAPYEETLNFGLKMHAENSFANIIFQEVQEGDSLEVSLPKGRFTLAIKPNEKRTILAFAAGIGITPILSHLKNILFNEELSRCFLFFGNRDLESIAFRKEIENLVQQYPERFSVYHFISREKINNPMLNSRIDEKRVELIINQILGIDEEDDESTIWDATDEILICGPGPMIKSVAQACYENGIRKKNIHFELFEAFDEDIYEVEASLPHLENVKLNFELNGKSYSQNLESNITRIMKGLLDAGYEIPYSCKSGICGVCQCRVKKGEVHMLENEFLTDQEVEKGMVLPCVSVALSQEVELDFDHF